MCKHCGCDTAARHHGQSHRHGDGTHHHHHHAGRTHRHNSRVAVETRLLEDNDVAAAKNRRWLNRRGIVALNLMSAPGSGKTLLLEKTLTRLRGKAPCAVITGDIQTTLDAQRLQGHGAAVRQIETHGACHLDAGRIAAILPGIAAPRAPRILFIENIGNLVCPSAFDLGEHVRVALLSVTEGEDKPLKYPALFAQASVVIITKTDLLPHLDFDLAACRRNLRCLKPDVLVIETSSRTGKGLGEWITYLKRLLA